MSAQLETRDALFDKFEDMLRRHEWYFTNGVWISGDAAHADVMKMRDELSLIDCARAYDLWYTHCPWAGLDKLA